MAMQDHLTLTVMIDGVIQAKLTNVSVNGDSGSQPVQTIEGLAGKTRGSGQLELSGTWAVPIGGLEYDFWSEAAEGGYHDVQIPVGTKSIVSRGWFQNVGLSQSTNASTEATATFIGTFEPLK